MAKISDKHNDHLTWMKEQVNNWYKYNKPNIDRFHAFRKFVFSSTLSDGDIILLQEMQKPQIEFNISEAYISRLRGEFSKQEPSIIASSMSEEDPDPQLISSIEGIIRHILFESKNNGTEYALITDLLSGGFSSAKVISEYSNDMSFHPNLKFERCYDPTMVGYDLMARAPHKGDGRFAFECFPMRKKDYIEMYEDAGVKDLKFSRNIEGFQWTYQNINEDIVVLCDFYEKKTKRVKIVQLSNGKVVTKDQYKKFLLKWETNEHIPQPAMIVNERWTTKTTICRYRFIENQILEYNETEDKILPLVYFDGNSIDIREGSSDFATRQMTRPYTYNAMGIQRLMNFAGQCLANELENMIQHKVIVAKEAIPEGYIDAYTKPQIPSNYVYNAYKNNDPNIPLPPPQVVQRNPIPPEVSNTFMSSMQVMQGILGSYDASLGINSNQLSGVAIVEGATQSNSAAMPYIVGFMQGLNQIAQVFVDKIPRTYITPRTVPVRSEDGSNSYIHINKPGAVDLDFDDNSIGVKVEASVSFSIQKSRALQQITAMMQASQQFSSFMNAVGLPILIDNMEIHGQDKLKEAAEEFMQTQQAAMQKQQSVPNPIQTKLQLDATNMQHKIEQGQADFAIKQQKLAIDKEYALNDRLKLINDMQMAQEQSKVQLVKTETERMVHAADLSMKEMDIKHQHAKDKAHLAHELLKNHHVEQNSSGIEEAQQ